MGLVWGQTRRRRPHRPPWSSDSSLSTIITLTCTDLIVPFWVSWGQRLTQRQIERYFWNALSCVLFPSAPLILSGFIPAGLSGRRSTNHWWVSSCSIHLVPCEWVSGGPARSPSSASPPSWSCSDSSATCTARDADRRSAATSFALALSYSDTETHYCCST